MKTGAGAVPSGHPSAVHGWAKSVARYCLRRCAAPVALLLGASAGSSQPVPSETPETASGHIQARIIEVARSLRDRPRLRRLTEQEREYAVEFVAGNMLFVMLHEVGHAAIADFRLPVLGREEDAADDFAILRMLEARTAFTDRVLAEATKGWFFNARRDRNDGEPLAFYDEHGLDEQRAYQIVCLMVGHDPDGMADLAHEMKLPDDRRESCKKDFETASASWATVLRPHLRDPGQPMVRIETSYGDGEGDLVAIAKGFRTLRLLETVASRIADTFAWPVPLALEMKSCGVSNARWNEDTRRLTLCYELAADFVALDRDFGHVAPVGERPARPMWQTRGPSSRTGSAGVRGRYVGHGCRPR